MNRRPATEANAVAARPEFMDNRAGNTLEAALNARLLHLAETLKHPVRLAIATGYFNPEGFARIAAALNRTAGVRLLLGAEPIPPPARPVRRLSDPRGERFERQLTDEALRLNAQGLLRDRDRLAFDGATYAAVRRLLEFLRSGRIEVRRYEKRFLHGKAFLFSHENGIISGSSNFTAAGLTSNLELNLGQYQPSVTSRVERWFEELWSEATPFDLAAIYEARLAEYAPHIIYLRVLWERYGHELEKEALAAGRLELTRFQTDGLTRARRMLERYNGVLIADSVGLGKSFVAGELIDEVMNRQRQRVLLIAPAALRDGTWARFMKRFDLRFEVKSFEQIAADRQLGGDEEGLDAPLEQYSLIVVDEAHAFRNPDTQRARALRQLLRADPPRKLVLMTATPVNNSLWDLYDLLTYFVHHDAVFADLGIPSLKRRFDDAAKKDPFTLKPDLLFDVLDETTVRRTRHFVKKFYPHDQIKLPDSTRVTIQFPAPHVKSVSYDLEEVLPGFFTEFKEALAPEHGEPRLTLARYWPSRYRPGAEVEAREAALVGLIRSGLLKRFESSAYAFGNTVAKMTRAHENFLRALDRGVILAPGALEQLEETDSDETWEELVSEGQQLEGAGYDSKRLRADVESDLALLRGFHARAVTVFQGNDPKLALLVEELAAILLQVEREGGVEHRRDRRKVLIFSYFADTVEWIADFLKERVATDHRLAAYRGRLAFVRGTESYDDVGRRQAVYGFAPVSSEAPPGFDQDRFDILVTTDVLAEGQNLQQAARIINYDLPWNPMRLVQRHGRIDRIGSPHRDVYITCVFPDRQLEALLTLEHRIRRKLAQAAASIGLDQVVIPGMEATEQVFADEVQEIRKLRAEDATIFETAGEDVHAHSGEEYRQELRKGLERHGQEIRELPGGAGSGLRRGSQRGHFFCAKVDDKVLLRFVPMDGAPVIRDALTCLGRITCEEETRRELPKDLEDTAFDAWEKARTDIYSEWLKATDPKELLPPIRPLFRAAANHLRQHRPEDMSLEELDRIVESLEAPWGTRVERALREVFTPEAAEGQETSRRIVDRVRELGLQPWKPPQPLPPIDKDDIVLVVWMAVEAESPSSISR
jgi:phosphatidylserine/phosphatidylglycerophosphate/cardiolipin synthase-like enzyme